MSKTGKGADIFFEAKKDKGKSRMDLIDWKCIEGLADILTFGAEKYDANSWQDVPDGENRYFAALMRHLIAYRKGQMNDPESGMNHLHHAMCNIMFLLHFQDMEISAMIEGLNEEVSKGVMSEDQYKDLINKETTNER